MQPTAQAQQVQLTAPHGLQVVTVQSSTSLQPESTLLSGQATTIPHAFHTETLQDPAGGAWNMYTGASSHLNASSTCLSDVFNTCLYPSISVGDGHSIPVTNTCHSILPTSHGSLHLRNVLITPSIVKNIIYLRQFVRDNNCTIEFDAFGFSVKDFATRRVLLRCDSTRDLYLVTSPSPIPHAYLKPPVLCHACQLGKHVRLPFVSSEIVFVMFRQYVHTQFKCEIKSFQCDHGGEFDNRALHKCFADNGIQFRFSCTKTSQQNVFPYGTTPITSAPTYYFLNDTPDIISSPIPSTVSLNYPTHTIPTVTTNRQPAQSASESKLLLSVDWSPARVTIKHLCPLKNLGSIFRLRQEYAKGNTRGGYTEKIVEWAKRGGGGGGGGEVFGGGVFGGSVVFSGDGVGNGVRGVVCGVACRVVFGVSHGAEGKDSFVKCDMTGNDDFVGVQVKAPISTMIVKVPRKIDGVVRGASLCGGKV
ncbi:ribonuclease H-like domain-containing protein [Tanacetum coccineum]